MGNLWSECSSFKFFPSHAKCSCGFLTVRTVQTVRSQWKHHYHGVMQYLLIFCIIAFVNIEGFCLQFIDNFCSTTAAAECGSDYAAPLEEPGLNSPCCSQVENLLPGSWEMSLEEAGNCFRGVTEIQIVEQRVAVGGSWAWERTGYWTLPGQGWEPRACGSSALTAPRCNRSQLGLAVTAGRGGLSGCRVGDGENPVRLHHLEAVNLRALSEKDVSTYN